jgi:hypothetical protein
MSQPASPPISPGQRVAVFLDEQASGTTLGYYGTVVSIREDACYAVYVPFFSRTILVRECNLIAAALDEAANNAQSVDSLEIRFETLPQPDNHELKGAFRRKDRAVACVSFQTYSESHASL